MATPTEIASMALGYVGDEAITSIDQANKRARACKLYFDSARKRALRMAAWKSCTKRAEIGADSTPPAFGWTNRYLIPGDYERLVGIMDTNHDRQWDIEGNYILCDLSAPLRIKYVFDQVDTGKFDAILTTVMAHALAIDICQKITGSNAKKAELKTDFDFWVKQGKSVNGKETSPQDFQQQSWGNARQQTG